MRILFITQGEFAARIRVVHASDYRLQIEIKTLPLQVSKQQ